MKKKTYSTRKPFGQYALWGNTAPALSYLDIELTERCNNNCLHCYINLPPGNPAAKKIELSTSEICDILKEAASLGCLTVRFSGGEPLLRDDFEELYLFARRSGLHVSIFTNGTLITSRLAGLFRNIPPLEKIVVSVYGMNRESYEGISQVRGSFNAFRKGVNLLLNHEIPFEAKAALLPIKVESFLEFEAWAETIPWKDKIHAQPVSLFFSCRNGDEARNKRIRGFRFPPDRLLEIEARKPEAYANDIRKFCSRFHKAPGDNLFNCGAGIGRASVDAYGKLKLCMLLRHPETVYDLKKGSIADALANFFPKVRETKATNPHYLERCARCFLHSLCAQCPAVSWMENKTLDGWLKYFCEFTHAQARFIGLLGAGEKSWEVTDGKMRLQKTFKNKCIREQAGKTSAARSRSLPGRRVNKRRIP